MHWPAGGMTTSRALAEMMGALASQYLATSGSVGSLGSSVLSSSPKPYRHLGSQTGVTFDLPSGARL